MDQSERDAAEVRVAPPMVYLVAVVVGVVLHGFVLPLPLALPLGLQASLCAVTAILGLTLLAGAFGLFKRSGQDPRPWTSSPALVTGGVYRYTRNPMYLALALLQASLGVGLGNGWIVLLVVPALVAIERVAVRPEEAYLEEKFGEAYLRYKASVRRWI